MPVEHQESLRRHVSGEYGKWLTRLLHGSGLRESKADAAKQTEQSPPTAGRDAASTTTSAGLAARKDEAEKTEVAKLAKDTFEALVKVSRTQRGRGRERERESSEC